MTLLRKSCLPKRPTHLFWWVSSLTDLFVLICIRTRLSRTDDYLWIRERSNHREVTPGPFINRSSVTSPPSTLDTNLSYLLE